MIMTTYSQNKSNQLHSQNELEALLHQFYWLDLELAITIDLSIDLNCHIIKTMLYFFVRFRAIIGVSHKNFIIFLISIPLCRNQ